MRGIRINESVFPLKNGELGTIAIFIYGGSGDPNIELDWAISQYTKDFNGKSTSYIELMDSGLNMPFMRTIVIGVNEMYQEDFDTNKHHALYASIKYKRNSKLKDLGI